MKYKQSSETKIKSGKKSEHFEIKSTIQQHWKVSTENPKEILAYSLQHIYLSTLCNCFHTIKVKFFQSRNKTMKQILQQQLNSKEQIYRNIQRIFISRLRYPYQKIKQRFMFSDSQAQFSSQNQNDLRSYMRKIKLGQIMELAICTLQSTYQRLIQKSLLIGIINLKGNMKKKKVYENQENLQTFCQKVQTIIQFFQTYKIDFAFNKMFQHYEFKSQQIQNVKSVKKHNFQTFGKAIEQNFENIYIHNQSSNKKSLQKHYNRRNINQRQKRLITKTQDKNKAKQERKQKNMEINIKDYEEYQDLNQIKVKNQKTNTHYQYESSNLAKQQKYQHFKSQQRKNNKFKKDQFQDIDFDNKINQMPTQRTNYRHTRHEEFQDLNEENNQQRYQTPFQRLQYEHLPITQRIQKKSFKSQQYIQNNQQMNSQSQTEENIVQQIYIIRNYKQKPKRKPDHFVKVPILSSDINVVQIQNPRRNINQYEQKSISFYKSHACKNCKYCKMVQQLQEKIQFIKKLSVTKTAKVEKKEIKITSYQENISQKVLNKS